MSGQLRMETLPLGHEHSLESLCWGANTMFRNGAVVVDGEMAGRRSVRLDSIWWRGGDLRVLSRSRCGAPSRRARFGGCEASGGERNVFLIGTLWRWAPISS